MMLSEATPIRDAPTALPSKAPGALAVAERGPDPGRERSQGTWQGGLVLTRHPGESIMIGDEVEVIVVEIRSGTARLKVVAPRTIAVHRREIFDAIRSESESSAPFIVPERSSAAPIKASGALVLARSARQSIMIGQDVEIGVEEVRPSTIKLRICAPRAVAVHRREVFDALQGDPA